MPVPAPQILTCARDGCGELFFQTRIDRRFCSTKCAQKEWYQEVISGQRRPKQRSLKAVPDAQKAER